MTLLCYYSCCSDPSVLLLLLAVMTLLCYYSCCSDPSVLILLLAVVTLLCYYSNSLLQDLFLCYNSSSQCNAVTPFFLITPVLFYNDPLLCYRSISLLRWLPSVLSIQVSSTAMTPSSICLLDLCCKLMASFSVITLILHRNDLPLCSNSLQFWQTLLEL